MHFRSRYVCAQVSVIAWPRTDGFIVTDIYYIAFPNDKPFTKGLVYALYMLETAQTAMMSHDGIMIFGIHFGDTSYLKPVHLAFFTPIFTAISEYSTFSVARNMVTVQLAV